MYSISNHSLILSFFSSTPYIIIALTNIRMSSRHTIQSQNFLKAFLLTLLYFFTQSISAEYSSVLFFRSFSTTCKAICLIRSIAISYSFPNYNGPTNNPNEPKWRYIYSYYITMSLYETNYDWMNDAVHFKMTDRPIYDRNKEQYLINVCLTLECSWYAIVSWV